MKQYFWNLLISIDQFFNALFGGDPDETLSSRMGKHARTGCKFCGAVCWMLDKVDKDHCEKAIEYDRGKQVDMK